MARRTAVEAAPLAPLAVEGIDFEVVVVVEAVDLDLVIFVLFAAVEAETVTRAVLDTVQATPNVFAVLARRRGGPLRRENRQAEVADVGLAEPNIGALARLLTAIEAFCSRPLDPRRSELKTELSRWRS